MKLSLRGALGILLSAAFLYLAFRNVPLDAVLQNLRRADPWMLLLATITSTVIFPLRARRWRPILDPIAPGLPFDTLWRPTAIGMMLNNVTPARAGEIARAFLLSRATSKVPFPAAFASLAVDRLLDAAVVFLLMFGAMLDPAFPKDAQVFGRSMSSIAFGGMLFIGVVLVAMYAMVLFPSHVLTLYELVVRRIAPRFEARGKVALESLVHGLSVLRTPSRFASVLFWTLLHWLVNALAFWFAFKAVHIDAPYSAGLFLQGLIAIGVAAPQAPGFFGVFEYFGKEGLGLYGVAPDAAATWAISFHFLSYVPITLIGAWYFLRTGMTLGELNTAERAAEAAPDA
jgi:uncharacterized protein (TIRG00374 family)